MTALEQRLEAGSELRFDWLMTGMAAWFLIGAYIDSWAHRHISDIESFFTPWHAILYSGYFAGALALAARAWYSHKGGSSWADALPRAYRLSAIGAAVFFLGGIGDMFWHIAFGIEASTAALLSPTHLLLACGAAIMASGPLRAAWERWQGETPPSFADVAPAIISAAGVLATLAFITQFASPFASTWASAARDPHVAIGIPGIADRTGMYALLELDEGLTSILLQAAMMMGVVLYVLRDRLLLPGAMTVIIGIGVTLMAYMVGPDSLEPRPLSIVLVAVIAGVLCDVLLARLRPSTENLFGLRVFAFCVPVIVYGSYLILLRFAGGVWWSVHVALGICVMAGIVGWLETFLLVPRAPVRESG